VWCRPYEPHLKDPEITVTGCLHLFKLRSCRIPETQVKREIINQSERRPLLARSGGTTGMQHRLGEGPLLDARGRLVERGWSTAEVRQYERSAIRANGLRIKEWDYYCILTPDFGLALTVADNAYLGFLGTSWMDLKSGTAVNDGAVIPFPMGRMGLPASPTAATSSRNTKTCR
jgi:hypothetical protein